MPPEPNETVNLAEVCARRSDVDFACPSTSSGRPQDERQQGTTHFLFFDFALIERKHRKPINEKVPL
jgi:hypothetical protein